MKTRNKTKSKAPYFTTTVDVDVDIDPDELHDAGWHHEDECPASPTVPGTYFMIDHEIRGLCAAVASLHRQAHPRETLSVRGCHEEPCRSLSLEQLGQVDGC